MELVHNVCLGALVADYLFLKPRLDDISFDPQVITRYGFGFPNYYNADDATILLQLSLMVTDSNFKSKALELSSRFRLHSLSYDQCPMELISKGLYTSDSNNPSNVCYIIHDPVSNTIIIVFSGTSNLCMAGADLDYSLHELSDLANYSQGIKGHYGIYLTYKSVRQKIIDVIKPLLRSPTSSGPPVKLIITGHSLGGALSTVCAFDMAFFNPIHYSFASPLFFNPRGAEAFQKYVQNSYRIANLSDIVTMLPLPVMPNGNTFCHVGKDVLFQLNIGTASSNHSAAYVIHYGVPIYYYEQKENQQGGISSLFRLLGGRQA